MINDYCTTPRINETKSRHNFHKNLEHLILKYKNKLALLLINNRKHECTFCQTKNKHLLVNLCESNNFETRFIFPTASCIMS